MSFRKNLQTYAQSKDAILEIGPLDKAVFQRPHLGGIFYADHVNTAQLRLKYQTDPDVNILKIPEIDFDLSMQSWKDISKLQKFDLIFASHVLEHIPDPIQWLNELSDCLKEDGKIVLVVPDKRFTFDFLQQATTLKEILQNHSEKPNQPTKKMVVRYFKRVTVMRPKLTWAAPWLYGFWAPKTFEKHATEIGELAETQYIDVHCHFWTPQSFKSIFHYCHQAQLSSMELIELVETERHDIEFLAIFAKRPTTARPLPEIEQIDSQILQQDRAPAFGLVKSFARVIRNRVLS